MVIWMAAGPPFSQNICDHSHSPFLIPRSFAKTTFQGPLLKGNAFVGANPQSERWVDILDAVVRVSGAKGYRLRAPAENMRESESGFPSSPTTRTPMIPMGVVPSVVASSASVNGNGNETGVAVAAGNAQSTHRSTLSVDADVPTLGLSPPASPSPLTRRTSMPTSPSPLGGVAGREAHEAHQARERAYSGTGSSDLSRSPVAFTSSSLWPVTETLPLPIPGAQAQPHTLSPRASAASLTSIASSVSATSASNRGGSGLGWGLGTLAGGNKTYPVVQPADTAIAMEAAWASTTNLRPTLAHSLTGWSPRKPGLVDGMDLYW